MPTQSSPTQTPQATEIAELTAAIEANFESRNGWFDAACHECEAIECIHGSAADLATKIHALGWCVENREHGNLNCGTCANYIPPTNPIWEREDHNITLYKESINA